MLYDAIQTLKKWISSDYSTAPSSLMIQVQIELVKLRYGQCEIIIM